MVRDAYDDWYGSTLYELQSALGQIEKKKGESFVHNEQHVIYKGQKEIQYLPYTKHRKISHILMNEVCMIGVYVWNKMLQALSNNYTLKKERRNHKVNNQVVASTNRFRKDPMMINLHKLQGNELSLTLRFPTLRQELRNLLKDTHFTDCFAMSELGFRKCLQFFVFLPEGYTEILEDLKKDPESHGGPPDCILLCRLREQVLRELGFQDIFKKVEGSKILRSLFLVFGMVVLLCKAGSAGCWSLLSSAIPQLGLLSYKLN